MYVDGEEIGQVKVLIKMQKSFVRTCQFTIIACLITKECIALQVSLEKKAWQCKSPLKSRHSIPKSNLRYSISGHYYPLNKTTDVVMRNLGSEGKICHHMAG